MTHEQCSLGITTRALRWAFRDEMPANPRLVRSMAKLAGIEKVQEIGEITLKYREGLTVTCVDASGKPIKIAFDIQIDEARGAPVFLSKGKRPRVRTAHKGSHRVLTVAPKEWFSLTANAKSAVNMVSLEQLGRMGSPSFQDALTQACQRGARSFKELRRPKLELPGWVKRRLYR